MREELLLPPGRYACYTRFSLGDRVLRVLSTIVLCGGVVIVKLLMSSDIQYGRNVSLN